METKRRFIILNALLLVTLLTIVATTGLVPAAPSDVSPLTYTLDRGGLLRFDNGKADVQAAYALDLNGGPLQVPYGIADWQGVDFPLNFEAVGSIQPELLINRVYRTPRRDSAFLTIIGANTSRKLHRPEICYSAADWTLTDMPVHNVSLDGGQVGLAQLLAHNRNVNDDRVILFWYLWRDGRRRIEDGAYVIQVAAPIGKGGLDQAYATAERFVRLILLRTATPQPFALRIPFVH